MFFNTTEAQVLISSSLSVYQWIGRIKCTSDEIGVAETGENFTIKRPAEKEMNRHLFVAVVSLLHEAEHIATDELLNSDNACTADSGHEPTATGCISPAPGQASRQKRSTPPHIGTTKFKGKEIGDSGSALEDIVFGGRFMHMEKRSLPPFLVCFLPMVCSWNIQLTCRFCSDDGYHCTSEGIKI